MKRTQLEELLLFKALAFKHMTGGGDILDMIPDDELPKNMLKNVCAKVSIELAERLDSRCSLLSISKRRFVEAAIIEALNKADEIIAETEILEADQPESTFMRIS